MVRGMKTKNDTLTVGIDIGRVIITGDGPDSSFLGGSEAQAMRCPPVAGAFESITRLARHVEGKIWLVSKCGPRVQALTRRWLDRHRFFQTTGVPYGHLRFCLDRRDKAPICAELGVGVFVDDRLDVLDAMAGVVAHRFLFAAHRAPTGVIAVPDWGTTEAAVLRAMSVSPAASSPVVRGS